LGFAGGPWLAAVAGLYPPTVAPGVLFQGCGLRGREQQGVLVPCPRLGAAGQSRCVGFRGGGIDSGDISEKQAVKDVNWRPRRRGRLGVDTQRDETNANNEFQFHLNSLLIGFTGAPVQAT